MSNNENEQPPQSPKPPKRRNGWLIPILLGVIIGVLLVTFALPALNDADLLPNQSKKDDSSVNDAKIDRKEDGKKNQSVEVDVSTEVTKVVEEVTPAVVGVANLQRQSNFWQRDQDRDGGNDSEKEMSVGSGVIYKKDTSDAYVVTNHHVIDGADKIEVVLSDDTHVNAKLLGSDLFSDLAVLKMDSKDVKKVVDIGSSNKVKVGEPAIAIGNPLGLMFSGSVTQGVISGKERTVPQDFNNDGRPDWQAEVIQTDAAINPGNSGGALINIAGQLIGINSMKINQTAVEGIGFAIPVDTAMPIIDELETKGEIIRPYLGVEAYALEEVPKSEWQNTLKLPKSVEAGVYLMSVETGSPADEAGLRKLDVITEIDGHEVESMIDLREVLYDKKEVGDEVTITYYREGSKDQVKLKLGEQKSNK